MDSLFKVETNYALMPAALRDIYITASRLAAFQVMELWHKDADLFLGSGAYLRIRCVQEA